MFAALTSLGVVVVVGYLWRRRKIRSREALLKPDFVKDKVYLVQFPVSPDVRSISPFSLKVETWLRLKGIPYENIYTLRFGRKGQIPYIELNGEQIPDSNVIIKRLAQHFNVKPDESFYPEQEALGHTVVRMIENHTCKGNFLWRYVNMGGEFIPRYFNWLTPRRLAVTKFFFDKSMRLSMYAHGIGRHSTEEINNFVCEDLHAISRLLGDKKYFFGEKLSETDCALFGHLAQFYYVNLSDFPMKNYLVGECPNLVSYIQRIREDIWPDWEEKCKADSMDNRMY